MQLAQVGVVQCIPELGECQEIIYRSQKQGREEGEVFCLGVVLVF